MKTAKHRMNCARILDHLYTRGFRGSCSSEVVQDRILTRYGNTLWSQKYLIDYFLQVSRTAFICPKSRKQVFTQVVKAEQVVAQGGKREAGGRPGDG